jgi:hypothetical protein
MGILDRFGQARIRRLPFGRLTLQLLAVTTGGQRHHSEMLPLAAQHIERAAADRAGGTEKGNSSHQITPNSR